jgi:hypothetical protein
MAAATMIGSVACRRERRWAIASERRRKIAALATQIDPLVLLPYGTRAKPETSVKSKDA